MALNNESIVGADLVAWVSMGIQHVPRAEVHSCLRDVATPLFPGSLYHSQHLPPDWLSPCRVLHHPDG